MRAPLRLAPAFLVLGFGCCATASSARAEDGKAAPPQAADSASEYDTLSAAFRKAQGELHAEAVKAGQEFRRRAAEAKERGEPAPAEPALFNMNKAAEEYVPKFAAFAEKHPDAPQVVDALVFVVQNGANLADKGPATTALKALLARHADDAKVQNVAFALERYAALGIDPATAREDLVRRSTNPEIRAAALYGPVSRTFALGSKATDDEKKAARPVVERVAKEFPDTRWGRRAAGTLNELDRLQVGMVAPDFEGKGADGKTIRLSDFRGKAVLLDYWGYW